MPSDPLPTEGHNADLYIKVKDIAVAQSRKDCLECCSSNVQKNPQQTPQTIEEEILLCVLDWARRDGVK